MVKAVQKHLNDSVEVVSVADVVHIGPLRRLCPLLLPMRYGQLLRAVCVCTSLVPRPTPPPVFDHLQYANIGGKAREFWSHAVMSSSQEVHTQTILKPLLVQGLEAGKVASV